MPRLAVLLALLAATGCTWAWDDFPVGQDGGALEDAGTDAGRADAGRIDAGDVTCEAGRTACPEPGVCVRPAGAVAPCCPTGACLDRSERPLAWARHTDSFGFSRDDAVAAEMHWLPPTRVYPLTSVQSGDGLPDSSDAAVAFRVAWSRNGIMVFVDVIDDDVRADTGVGWEEVDSVELVLDVDPTSPGPPDDTLDAADETRIVFTLRPGSPRQVEQVHLGPREWTGTQSYAATSGAGFTMELGISWVDLAGGALPTEEDVIGLDVIFHDRDGDGASVDVHRWNECARPRDAALGLVVLSGLSFPRPTLCGQVCTDTDLCVPMSYKCDPLMPTLCTP